MIPKAIYFGDYGKVQELIDPLSFARTYIVNELFHTTDIHGASFFMYREVGGRLHSGPIWDYDNSSSNTSNLAAKDPHRLWSAIRNNR